MKNMKNLLPLNVIMPTKHSKNTLNASLLLTELSKNNIIFTPKAINLLMYSPTKYLKKLNEELNSLHGIKLRDSFGSGEDVKFTFEEAFEQIKHYCTTYGLGYTDEALLEEKSSKFTEFEKNPKFTVIDSITQEEYFKLVENIINSPIVFGETQQNILRNSDVLDEIIEEIEDLKLKENILFLVSINKKAGKFLKTATDLLRYIYLINDLDFRDLKSTQSKDLKIKLKTSDKRFIMDFLNNFGNPEELKKYKSYWIRVSNNLKPMSGKYSKYSNAQNLFRMLKNETIRTFFSFYDTKNTIEKAKMLSKRPGEFLRRMDELIRKSSKKDLLVLCKIINKTEFNPKLLIQVIPYLKFRMNNDVEERIFNVKGKPKSVLGKGLTKLVNANPVILELEDKLKKHLGTKKIFNNFTLSDELKKYIFPTEIRDLSATNGIRYTPGTRVKIKTKYLRAFTAWGTKKGNANFDIDLGCILVNKNGDFQSIAYYNQSEDFAQHSGDFTSCIEYKPGNPKITAEFVDIDIEKAKNKFDYAIFNSIIFSSGAFENDFSTDVYSYSGIMERNERSKKSININDSLLKMTLSGKFQSHVPFAIDFNSSEIVFIDKYFKSSTGSNVYSNSSNSMLFKREYFKATQYKMNMYDLLSSIQNPNLIDGEDTITIDNQFVSDNLEEILDLLNI